MSGSKQFGPGYNFPGFSEPSSKPILTWDPDNPATFLELVDTINSYAGLAGRAIIVNPTEDGLTTTGLSIVSDKHHVHVQLAATTTWNITHALAKYPSVTVISTSGHVMEADVHLINTTTIEINFVNAKAGTAFLN